MMPQPILMHLILRSTSQKNVSNDAFKPICSCMYVKNSFKQLECQNTLVYFMFCFIF